MRAIVVLIGTLFWTIDVTAQYTLPVSENFNIPGSPYKVIIKDQAEEWKDSNTYPSSAGDVNHLMTNGNTGSTFYLEINTLGKQNIVIKWLQYREEAQATIASFTYSINNGTVINYTTGLVPAVGTTTLNTWQEVTVTLPAAVNNKSLVKLEWTINKRNGSAAGRQFRFDELRATGINIPTLSIAHATKNLNIGLNFPEVPTLTKSYEKYTVTGANLTSNVLLNVFTVATADTFLIAKNLNELTALNPVNYSNTLTIIPTGGSVSETIYVIYLGSSKSRSYNGNITHATTGVPVINLNLEAFTNPLPPAPFPVELATFKGQVSNGTTNLLWVTASEKNNDRFEVERSQDGEIFTKVGEVKGSGTSTTRLNYTFTDRSPARGVNYYRLRQVDTNGSEEFSNVIALEVAGGGAACVYPTVATSTVTISLQNTSGKATINVTDITGKTVATFNNTALQELELPVQNFKNGMYFVRVTDGQNQQVQRFIKE